MQVSLNEAGDGDEAENRNVDAHEHFVNLGQHMNTQNQ